MKQNGSLCWGKPLQRFKLFKLLFFLLLYREDKLKFSIERLKQDSIGADRITTKIERLAHAVEYCCCEKLLPSQDCQPVNILDTPFH